MKAIIGGSGLDMISSYESNEIVVETPYGKAYIYKKGNQYFLPRHKKDHSIAPSKINYRANIWALKELGVTEILALYAVGSITRKLSIGEVGIVEDFLDFTKGRIDTFYDGSVNELRHVSMTNLISERMKEDFIASFPNKIATDLVYVTTEGPRLETKAEIRLYSHMGADVVGMTLSTEAALIKELGIDYLPLCYSINWAAGVEQDDIKFLTDSSIDNITNSIVKIYD